MLLDARTGIKGHGVKACITDLPWGDTKVTDYKTDVDYSKLAEFLSGMVDSVSSINVEGVDMDLGKKRKRSSQKQEPIIVAMGDGEALVDLRGALAKKNIKVCLQKCLVL